MKTEKVFKIAGEGGGISINRQRNGSKEKFIYNHNEFDPFDDDISISVSKEYQTFEEPFNQINKKYPWYMLHFELFQNEYRTYIIEKLIEKLNDESVNLDYLHFSKNQLEEVLKIELIFAKDENKVRWDYKMKV